MGLLLLLTMAVLKGSHTKAYLVLNGDRSHHATAVQSGY
jgi:hypothetical protein